MIFRKITFKPTITILITSSQMRYRSGTKIRAINQHNNGHDWRVIHDSIPSTHLFFFYCKKATQKEKDMLTHIGVIYFGQDSIEAESYKAFI